MIKHAQILRHWAMIKKTIARDRNKSSILRLQIMNPVKSRLTRKKVPNAAFAASRVLASS